MTAFRTTADAVAWLRSPEAIRARCGVILAAAEDDRLEHFGFVPDRLDAAADYVVETMRRNYPDLAIPYHARWRHFTVGGIDRWSELRARYAIADPDEVARIRFDLVITSVLLDAGAGEAWRYRESESGQVFGRSEGLGVASLRMFAGGAFSADPARPLRADAAALAALSDQAIETAFQVGPDNPLVGIAGRAALMRRLGQAIEAGPDMFGVDAPRVGGLYDYLKAQAAKGALPAERILDAVLRGLAPIWPRRITLDGENLGDVWRHPAARSEDLTDQLVPFHKLSQWLTYSLLEPLEDAGLRVTDMDRLTGLPEYRNGGLLIDLGVLRPKHAGVEADEHAPGDPVIVEWRALTVALLDRLAERVRAGLETTAEAMPLAKVLEGGTWSAGRRIAAEKRPGGPPPIRLKSDGTVF